MSTTAATIGTLPRQVGGWNFFLVPYLIFLLIRPHEFLPWLQSVPAFPVFLGLSAAYWLLVSEKVAKAPQIWLVPALLASMIISMLAIGWFSGALNVFSSFGAVVLLFLFIAQGLNTTNQLLVLLRVVSICAAAVAVHGIQVAHLGAGWTGMNLSEQGRVMYLGFHSDPNDLGLFFLMCLPFMVMLGQISGFFLARLFWRLSALTTIYAIYLTHSRGALLSLAVMGALMIKRRYGLFLASIVGVIGLAGMSVLSSRQIEVGEASAFGRVSSWYEGMQMFIGNPLLGVGPGMYTEYNYLTAHNSLVLVLAELGYLGFFVWVSMVGYAYLIMRKLSSMEPAFAGDMADKAALPVGWITDQRVASALMYSIVGFLTAAFFLSRSFYPFLYAVLGFVVAHYANMRANWDGVPSYRMSDDFLRWVFGAAGLIVFLFITVKVLHMVA